uniref:Peptidase S1 domain-containing protein n=1 Tax=Tetraodon nigroviridis TaxID=99883 RepID=H3CZ69_TETNG
NSTMHALLRFLSFHLLLSFGPNALGSAIINGEDVPDKKMLYMASVQSYGEHKCGGFLIRNDFVLTAAHCDYRNLSVVLGTHNLKAVDGSMRYRVRKCKHPNFTKVINGSDIMLLKLEKKAQLGKRIQPIPIPKKAHKLKDNAKCLVAGWGFIKKNVKPVDLQMAEVPVIGMEECRSQWSQKPAETKLPKDVLCAGGYRGNKGFCQGDSGGPLVCGKQAVGIVSFNYNGDCEYPKIPNVYVDISKHLSWINKNMVKKIC